MCHDGHENRECHHNNYSNRFFKGHRRHRTTNRFGISIRPQDATAAVTTLLRNASPRTHIAFSAAIHARHPVIHYWHRRPPDQDALCCRASLDLSTGLARFKLTGFALHERLKLLKVTLH